MRNSPQPRELKRQKQSILASNFIHITFKVYYKPWLLSTEKRKTKRASRVSAVLFWRCAATRVCESDQLLQCVSFPLG